LASGFAVKRQAVNFGVFKRAAWGYGSALMTAFAVNNDGFGGMA
jgi:hypothetical protein